ncbi:uncharacterized protein LOC141710736 [Apium graveolens]|uniref:uncharacterized protein LOC141710736 n=1 Tax=Apium graveolens TaxID=4045 RepID=UPI003D7BACAF
MDQFQHNCFNAGAPIVATSSTLPPPPHLPPPPQRKRRRKYVIDDDDVEVIALSLEELIEVPTFSCELCNKSFIREQNMLMHQRAHNIPYVCNNFPAKNNDDEKKKVYVCPVITCAYHGHRNALSDLASLRKHYKRKHGVKTINCTKCRKTYAVEGDLKAHLKICGTKEYACYCGSIFSRWDHFVIHKISCDRALAHQMSLLHNELTQTSQTTVESSFSPTMIDKSISNYPKSHPSLNSNTTTNVNSFPSGNVILTSPISNLLPSNQTPHQNIMTFDYVPDNNNTQYTDNIYDVNVMHDGLFDVSSVHAQAAPQQEYSLGKLGSLMGSLENSAIVGFDNINNSNFYTNISGTYENPHQLGCYRANINNNVFGLQDETPGGRDPLLEDNFNTPFNENFFSTNLEDNTVQNDNPSGFGHNQISQLVQPSDHNIGGDAYFPILQNDFQSWKN